VIQFVPEFVSGCKKMTERTRIENKESENLLSTSVSN
jgi:hypothetical protein